MTRDKENTTIAITEPDALDAEPIHKTTHKRKTRKRRRGSYHAAALPISIIGGWIMKKICFGIAVMLFGFVFQWSMGYEYVACIAGMIGLGFAIVGLLSKEDK